jgi:methyl-accepting chemotaxis protein
MRTNLSVTQREYEFPGRGTLLPATDTSSRNDPIAANLQQASAAMEQQTSTARQNSDTARQASWLASATSVVARRGNEAVSDLVSTMERISDASRRIADIIGMIDGISFQTNTLNAAVEAARVGEQGQGFTVVAGEVRSLAQRSADAAWEVKGLIADSVGKINAGSPLISQADHTINDVAVQVQRITDLIAEITTASKEQTTGISQVGQAASQLDEMTQQNAAMAEQSSTATASVRDQAPRLMDAIRVFSV